MSAPGQSMTMISAPPCVQLGHGGVENCRAPRPRPRRGYHERGAVHGAEIRQRQIDALALHKMPARGQRAGERALAGIKVHGADGIAVAQE